MRSKQGVVAEMIPALLVPLVLIISVAVFRAFSVTSASSLAIDVTNQTVVLTPPTNVSGSVSSTKIPLEKFTTVYNGNTGAAVSLGAGAVTITNRETGAFVCGGNSGYTTRCNATIKVSYEGHDQTDEGWLTFEDVEGGTWSSYQLASMLPYIIIAVVVLGLIIGVFVFTRA